ncbi:MAG: bifunctional folylpolyglutamate synthase/dihydrofolate synthase [Parvibaculales bacterium]
MSNVRPASDDVLNQLLALHPKKIDLSLGRMTRLLDALDRPHEKLPPIVHVAGTNGKGSTLAMLRAMLEAAGQHVHGYSSPHLVRFHERINLAGTMISEAALMDILDRCKAANGEAPITFFEITTAAAFLAFAEHKADYVLLETGLGGRLDATNVTTPRLTAITPVSIDHQEFLGDSLAAIAGEKAGIIKSGVPLICAPQAPDAAQVIAAEAERLAAPASFGGQDWMAYAERDGLVFQDANGMLDLPLPALAGKHQITNAGTAIAMARHLGLSRAAIAEGLTGAVWPARLQKLSAGKWVSRLKQRLPNVEIRLDGGHNEAAAEMLADFIAGAGERPGRRSGKRSGRALGERDVHIILGMLANKAHQAFIDHLAACGRVAHLYAVPVEDSDAGLPPAKLADMARARGLSASAHAGFQAALDMINDPDALIIIAGSLYLAGQLLRANENEAGHASP